MTYFYQLTRLTAEGIDASATVTLRVADPLTVDEAWAKFREVVTEWATTADEGKALWEESVENLNVGDLLNYGVAGSREFRPICRKHHIAVEIRPQTFDASREYDEILVNPEHE